MNYSISRISWNHNNFYMKLSFHYFIYFVKAIVFIMVSKVFLENKFNNFLRVTDGKTCICQKDVFKMS